VAALDGDVAASLAGWRDALRLWRDLGARGALALCAIAMGSRLPTTEPEVRAALDEARAILVEIEGRPWLALLDAIDERAADDAPPARMGQRGGAVSAVGRSLPSPQRS
jgi:hypothetical protein